MIAAYRGSDQRRKVGGREWHANSEALVGDSGSELQAVAAIAVAPFGVAMVPAHHLYIIGAVGNGGRDGQS